MTISGEPACWSWPVTDVHLEAVTTCPECFAHFLLWNWQCGRCAACGVEVAERTPLVRDHDHALGHIRGLLCQRCNILEGRTAAGVGRPSEMFDRYRERPPVALLNLRARHAITCSPFGRPLPKNFTGPVPLPKLGDRWTINPLFAKESVTE